MTNLSIIINNLLDIETIVCWLMLFVSIALSYSLLVDLSNAIGGRFEKEVFTKRDIIKGYLVIISLSIINGILTLLAEVPDFEDIILAPANLITNTYLKLTNYLAYVSNPGNPIDIPFFIEYLSFVGTYIFYGIIVYIIGILALKLIKKNIKVVNLSLEAGLWVIGFQLVYVIMPIFMISTGTIFS